MIIDILFLIPLYIYLYDSDYQIGVCMEVCITMNKQWVLEIQTLIKLYFEQSKNKKISEIVSQNNTKCRRSIYNLGQLCKNISYKSTLDVLLLDLLRGRFVFASCRAPPSLLHQRTIVLRSLYVYI